MGCGTADRLRGICFVQSCELRGSLARTWCRFVIAPFFGEGELEYSVCGNGLTLAEAMDG